MSKKKASPYAELLSLGPEIGTLNAEIQIASAWTHEYVPVTGSLRDAALLTFMASTVLNGTGNQIVRKCKSSCATCQFLSDRRERLNQASQRYRALERVITGMAVERARKSGKRAPDTNSVKIERNYRIQAEAARLRAKGISRGIPGRLRSKFPTLSERQLRTIINSESTS